MIRDLAVSDRPPHVPMELHAFAGFGMGSCPGIANHPLVAFRERVLHLDLQVGEDFAHRSHRAPVAPTIGRRADRDVKIGEVRVILTLPDVSRVS